MRTGNPKANADKTYLVYKSEREYKRVRETITSTDPYDKTSSVSYAKPLDISCLSQMNDAHEVPDGFYSTNSSDSSGKPLTQRPYRTFVGWSERGIP